MNSTQPQATNSPKPTLHGVKIKQRKGVQKAQAKHEPEIFRDNLLSQLATAKSGDLKISLLFLTRPVTPLNIANTVNPFLKSF
ncbi:unnamed protein product [Absidia cylindrospora]